MSINRRGVMVQLGALAAASLGMTGQTFAGIFCRRKRVRQCAPVVYQPVYQQSACFYSNCQQPKTQFDSPESLRAVILGNFDLKITGFGFTYPSVLVSDSNTSVTWQVMNTEITNTGLTAHCNVSGPVSDSGGLIITITNHASNGAENGYCRAIYPASTGIKYVIA